jgi:hypothetical protein
LGRRDYLQYEVALLIATFKYLAFPAVQEVSQAHIGRRQVLYVEVVPDAGAVFFPLANALVPVCSSNIKIPERYIGYPTGGGQVLQYMLHHGLAVTIRVNGVQEYFLWYQDTLRDAVNSSA